MRMILALALMGSMAAPANAHNFADLLPGTYTNTEQSYFQGEAGEEADPWLGVSIVRNDDGSFRLQRVDAFGEARGPVHDGSVAMQGELTALTLDSCTRLFAADGDEFVLQSSEGECGDQGVISRLGPNGMTLSGRNDRHLDMRRARPVSCWISVRKTDPVPEGESEWTFDNGLMMHDQGGRIRAGGGDSGAPVAIARMRNVVWPAPSRNRPSLVLYIHTEDDPDRAVSYSWADPSANRIGINLRWMQASCTVQSEDDSGS